MSDPLWREQVTYRRRADEYDATAYGDVPGADEHLAALLAGLRPAGDVLELACGTGRWTRHLATRARTPTAVDTAPETLSPARRKAPSAEFRTRTAGPIRRGKRRGRGRGRPGHDRAPLARARAGSRGYRAGGGRPQTGVPTREGSAWRHHWPASG